MPPRSLPHDPSFEHLQKQAKRLLHAWRTRGSGAHTTVVEFHPRGERALTRPSLAGAQTVVARSYGFESWAALKRHVTEFERHLWNPTPVDPASPLDVFLRLACLTYDGAHHPNADRALQLLMAQPHLARADLYAAAAVGDVGHVRAVIDRQPSLVNTPGGTLRWAPLMYACYSRLPSDEGAGRSTLEAARLLLARGGDPNAGVLLGGPYAFTALTGAFGRGEDWFHQPPHPDCDALARALLEAGADPNDSQSLYNRFFGPDDAHLRLLFEYGLGRDGRGPWLRRLGGESATPALLLVQQLAWAVTQGFADRVRLLLDHGVDVNGRSRRTGRTAYEEAVRTGHDAIAAYLLERGATTIELDPVERFAVACVAGRRDEVRALLEKDPTLLTRLGRATGVETLHRAVDAGHHDAIRLVLELGIDINAMVPGTGMDRTVLHNAAAGGNLEMVKLLIELGADPNLRDLAYHSTAIGWARYNGQNAVVAHLLSSATIFFAVACGGVERVTSLLQNDPALAGAVDERGVPLAFYLQPDTPHRDEILRLLLAHGLDLNARNADGATVLDRVLAAGLTDLARSLRELGARSGSEG